MRATLAALLLLVIPGCVEPDHPAHDNPSADPSEATTPPAGQDGPPADAPPTSPYAGEEARAIKALSAEEIDGYRRGAGLGYAKPAELNSYPGPLHALEMGDRLQLTPAQRDEIESIRARMLDAVVPLGEEFLRIEAAIERHFREESMDADRLGTLLDDSARVESRIRFAHLDAHIATREILTRHQVALYDEARGYGEADHASHEHG